MGFKPRPRSSRQHVAFLRAINVGGRTVKKDELRAIFESAGLDKVETFIASGNVIFDSADADVSALEQRLEAHLERSLGYAVATFVRTVPQLAAISAQAPFGNIERSARGDALYVAFVASRVATEAVDKLAGLRNAVDDFRLIGRESYWLRRRNRGESKFSSTHWERALGRPCTVRNMNTIDRLVEKLSGQTVVEGSDPLVGLDERFAPRFVLG